MTTKEVNGYYGSGRTKAKILTAKSEYHASTWYCVQGSTIVNLTFDPIEKSTNVEKLKNVNCFTVRNPIKSLLDLEKAILS
jgi:hypothetical protein